MKKTKFIILLSIIIVLVIAIIPYVIYRFNFSGSFSAEHIKWAEFGDYLGGSISPILSFFSFIAILITLYFSMQSSLQQKKLTHINNYWDLSKDYENRIDLILDHKEMEFLNKYFNKNDRDKIMQNKNYQNNVPTIHKMSVELYFLFRNLQKIKELDNENPILYFYATKYNFLINNLKIILMIKEDFPILDTKYVTNYFSGYGM